MALLYIVVHVNWDKALVMISRPDGGCCDSDVCMCAVLPAHRRYCVPRSAPHHGTLPLRAHIASPPACDRTVGRTGRVWRVADCDVSPEYGEEGMKTCAMTDILYFQTAVAESIAAPLVWVFSSCELPAYLAGGRTG